MAATGFYMTFRRPRTHRPLSMLKYDPVGTFHFFFLAGQVSRRSGEWIRGKRMWMRYRAGMGAEGEADWEGEGGGRPGEEEGIDAYRAG